MSMPLPAPVPAALQQAKAAATRAIASYQDPGSKLEEMFELFKSKSYNLNECVYLFAGAALGNKLITDDEAIAIVTHAPSVYMHLITLQAQELSRLINDLRM